MLLRLQSVAREGRPIGVVHGFARSVARPCGRLLCPHPQAWITTLNASAPFRTWNGAPAN